MLFFRRNQRAAYCALRSTFCRVHPPASHASGCFAAISRHEVSCHCIAFRSAARQRGKQARCVSFRTGLLSRREAKRAIPFLQKRNAKHEHDRKLILNASTAEQHRQTDKIFKPTAGMENRFIERMSNTRRHTTLPDTGTGNGLLEFTHYQSSIFQSRMRMSGGFNPEHTPQNQRTLFCICGNNGHHFGSSTRSFSFGNHGKRTRHRHHAQSSER